ncbi:lysylphosphatidylglycerol synthase transmembrane domain-containing protein [Microvirga puerhi]|uniref:Flippase-like domain-containing protein n=1 Tax=Microvirga puerhi TaxID=2876078 RepID=A0ABS7VMP4_9HYPH|nr:lysylphosphatidylglycerol synthase transmembrane domain-containing protein [Microvirga puerhi]MBZ6076257.1 flippase-like domain-containing protein [Microvirga puerhi]
MRTLLVIAQVAVSLFCLSLLIFVLDWPGILSAMKGINFASMTGAILSFLVAQFVATWRMQLMLRIVGVSLRFREAIRLNWLGLASGNVLPSTVGGDVLIVLGLSRLGRPVMQSLTGLVLNRIVSILATIACLSAVLTVPALMQAIEEVHFDKIVLAAMLLVLLAAIGLIWARRWPALSRRLSEIWELVLSYRKHPWLAFNGFLMSVVILALGAVTFRFLLPELPGRPTFLPLIAIVSLIMVAQLVPISFNGLGIQEGLLTACLTLIGWSVDNSAAAAILIRLITIGLSLPGLLWIDLLWQRQERGAT